MLYDNAFAFHGAFFRPELSGCFQRNFNALYNCFDFNYVSKCLRNVRVKVAMYVMISAFTFHGAFFRPELSRCFQTNFNALYNCFDFNYVSKCLRNVRVKVAMYVMISFRQMLRYIHKLCSLIM